MKEILYRAAERAEVPMTLVANKLLGAPRSRFIHSLQVAQGFDVADNEIAKRLAPRDFLAKPRETGVRTGGPPPFDHTDRKRFADQLDRFLARVGRG